MKRVLLFILALAALCVVSNASAYSFAHWPLYATGGSLEHNIPLVNNTGLYYNGTVAAVGQWNASPYINLTASSGPGCTMESAKIKVCETAIDGVGGRAGSSSVGVDGSGHIYGSNSTLDIDDAYVHTSATWRQAVACHEIGHSLGLYLNLNERTEAGSCMKGTISDPPAAWTPDTQDYNNIYFNYAHYDHFSRPELAPAVYHFNTAVYGPDVAPWFLDSVTVTR